MISGHKLCFEPVHLNDSDFLTIPDAMISYVRDVLFNTLQSLEMQQGQATDPEIRAELDRKNEQLFEIWLSFRGL
jgi:hypothetical protein